MLGTGNGTQIPESTVQSTIAEEYMVTLYVKDAA